MAFFTSHICCQSTQWEPRSIQYVKKIKSLQSWLPENPSQQHHHWPEKKMCTWVGHGNSGQLWFTCMQSWVSSYLARGSGRVRAAHAQAWERVWPASTPAGLQAAECARPPFSGLRAEAQAAAGEWHGTVQAAAELHTPHRQNYTHITFIK